MEKSKSQKKKICKKVKKNGFKESEDLSFMGNQNHISNQIQISSLQSLLSQHVEN